MLLDRFLRYVQIETTSDSAAADKGMQPSTRGQRELAELLRCELAELGLKKIQLTESGYLYGFLAASSGCETDEPICLLAHLDTSEEVSGKNVRPRVHKKYSGQPIVLESDIVLRPDDDENLARAGRNGETIITSDGTTLLGADDKAGIAEIMGALAFFHDNPDVRHGPVEVCFSPDEETGHGMDAVPLELIQSRCAFTVDGGGIGGLETECFNAFKSEISFAGVAAHTGTARGKLVNAVSMAAAFISALPRHESPETTDGYMGFYAPVSVSGSLERSQVTLLLRDFDMQNMEKRKSFVELLAETTASSFGGTASVIHVRQYSNMKSGFDARPEIVGRLSEAYRKAGVAVQNLPIRGGTDGSRLTEMGIPTPNICTGGYNYHSRAEWCSLEQMEKVEEILIQLCKKDG